MRTPQRRLDRYQSVGRPGARFVMVAALVLLPLLTMIVIFHFKGPQWDLVAHSLNGRTLFNYVTVHSVSLRNAFIGEYAGNLVYYFEPYRAPLATPVFALLWIFFQRPVLPFMILSYVASVLAVYWLGRRLKVDTLVMFAAFLNPYILYFFFIPNGMEGLSAVFAVLGVIFLLRRSSWSGLLLGLASLAKYPALVLLPLVLLLWNRKKVAVAVALELVAVIPWLLFNYIAYGNPIYSYYAAVSTIVTGIAYIPVYPLAVLAVVAYPVVFIAAAFALWAQRGRKLAFKMSYNTKVIVLFVAMSAIGYAFVLPHNDFFTQERFGYIFSLSLIILSAFLFSKMTVHRPELRIYASAAAILVLAAVLLYSYYTYNSPLTMYYNPNSQNNVYANAETMLSTMGLGGCRFISNAWIPMLYLHYDAYSPFIRYSSNTITPIVGNLVAENGSSYPVYVVHQSRYPIVVVDDAGVSQSLVVGLSNATLAYNGTYFQVYLPRNATCYSG